MEQGTESAAARGASTSPDVEVSRALLSVSDKTGIVDFARGLAELGIEIISTGGTARELGVDSLHYLSLEGVYEAVGVTRETHCDACFSGVYPLAGTEEAQGKHALESELPLVGA